MILRVSGLTAGYAGGFRLRGINLEIKHRSLTGVIGPNGGGKTTLLKVLGGFLRPFKGSVYAGKADIRMLDAGSRGRLISYVASETRVNFPFTVAEVVMMGRNPHICRFGFETENDRLLAKSAMEKMGCYEFRDRIITELSSGQKQKVFLARAFCQQSDIMLMDEPVSHMDVNQTGILFRLIRASAEEGRTVVAVVHDLNLAVRYCEEIICIKDGEIFMKGGVNEIINKDVLEELFGGYIDVRSISGSPFVVP